MSLYALIRNSYDPLTKRFHLSASNIELEGHLDGNLCRCTGYKPILEAARTFITEDLKGNLSAIGDEDVLSSSAHSSEQIPYRSETSLDTSLKSMTSCGRPGGCCRDPVVSSEDEKSSSEDSSTRVSDPSSETASAPESAISIPDENETSIDGTQYGNTEKSFETHSDTTSHTIGVKTISHLDAPAPTIVSGIPQFNFKTYSPNSELIFPPGLKKHQSVPIVFGNSTHVWLRPVTLDQLLLIKDAYPSAKIVGGSSEVQIEIRFKHSSFPISVYVSDIDELRGIDIPHEWNALEELVFGANTPLTEVESVCRELATKLEQRGSVLEALKKQLRYFAGRQIRNVASLAGNIATASPISDLNPVLLASGASLTARSMSKGSFKLPMDTFFVGYRSTTLPPDAVITHIHIPLPPPGARELTKAYKQAKRKDDDIAIVTAAFRVRLNQGNIVTDISLVYGGMAPTTVAAKKAMKAILGKRWDIQATLEGCMTSLALEIDLSFEAPGGMATYRKTLALSLFFRFWHETISEFGLGEVEPDLISEIHRDISSGSRDNHNPHEQRVVGKQVPHLSALKQTTGEAQYVDDMPKQDRELYGAFVLSSRAHARLVEVDWSAALGPGLALGYVDKHSISKEANLVGAVIKDEPLFADGEVLCHGHPIGLVYAESALKAQAAARAVKVTYKDLPAILTIDEAIEANSFFKHGKMLKKGIALEDKMDDIWSKCDQVFEGVTRMGGQEHFYLETNSALVIPNKEDKTFEVWSSTQNT